VNILHFSSSIACAVVVISEMFAVCITDWY